MTFSSPSTAGFHPFVCEVLERVREVVGGPCGLHEPEFDEPAWRYVKETIDTAWVSSSGEFVGRFERALADFIGARHAVAVVNGTAALHTGLMLSGVQLGDEVLVPPLTFVATANAVTHAGAVPHFVDIEAETLGVDPLRLERYLAAIARRVGGRCVNGATGRPIAGLLCVHVFGTPCRVEELAAVCARFAIPLFEDATESLGSRLHGRHTGTFGRFGAFSFNGNKIITTGGGGAIITDDDTLAAAARSVTTTAKRQHRWAFVHDRVAYNYRLPNLNAALGCAQMEALQRFLDEKARLAARYRDAFGGLPGLRLLTEPAGCTANHWLNNLVLDQEFVALRDAILDATNDAGIQTRPVWTLLHRLPMYRNAPRGELPVASDMESRVVSLPSSARLGRSAARQSADAVREALA